MTATQAQRGVFFKKKKTYIYITITYSEMGSRTLLVTIKGDASSRSLR